MTDKAIKFPSKHYVGFQARPSVDEVPLGFMTPWGTDAAAKKRMATVDSWAAGGGYSATNKAKDKLPAQEFENEPMVGFKLGRSIRHGGSGWGQGNVKWRIEDPRGFELEISSPNFAQVIAFCNIEKGEIQEQCIWARLGSENILVPCGSDVYQNAIVNTERMAKKASLRDLKIGDSAVMHNGDQGIYYGAHYIVSRRTRDYNSTNEAATVICGAKKRHIFLMQGSDGLSSQKFFKAIGSPKLSELFEGTWTKTIAEAEAEIMRLVREEAHSISESTNDYYASPIAVSAEPLDVSTLTLERVDDTLTSVLARHKASGKRPYYVGEIIHQAIPLFDLNDQLVTINLQTIENAQAHLPGGPNHQNLVQQQAQRTAYPNHYSNHPLYTDCYYQKVINDPSDKGIIQFDSTGRSYSYSYNQNKNYVDVNNIPDDFHYYRKVGKTTNGTEIVCYL